MECVFLPLRSVRNYLEILDQYHVVDKDLIKNDALLAKSKQKVANVIWFFNNQEISIQELRDELNLGKSIIVGLSNNGGTYPDHYSDHWVVLRSVDGDSFRINDPAYSGAMKVPLNDHYAGWTIIQAKIYN